MPKPSPTRSATLPCPMPCAIWSTVTRHYVINFAYNDLEDFKVTADVRKQSVPDAIRQIIGFYPIAMKVVKGEGQDSKGHLFARHDLRGVHTEGRP